MFTINFAYISSVIISVGGVAGAIYAIWRLISPLTEKGKQKIEQQREARRQEGKEIATLAAQAAIAPLKTEIAAINRKLDDLGQADDEFSAQLVTINDKIDKNEIHRLRQEMLGFAAILHRGGQASLEEYGHIFEMHAKYEQLIEETGVVNGRIDAEMKYIEQKFYQLENKGEG